MKMAHSPDISLPGVVSSQSEQDDTQLVRAIQRGNQEAFALLVRKYQRRIFQLSLGMLQDEHDASESTQEAFVAAWQGLPGFRDEARFSIWLYHIAYQCGLRQLGRRKREHTRHSAGQVEQVVGGIRPEKQGVDTSERHDMQTLVQEQVEHLPLTYRTALILRHLHNKTYEEIADIISIPLGMVKTRLFRARTLLKERVKAPLVKRETIVGTTLTENEEVMHTLGSFPFQGREQDSIPDNQETDGFSQHQQAWLEQQQGWVEQQRSALAQQEAWLEQRRAWLGQQQGWIEQRRGWLDEQRSWIEQRRGWLTQQGDKLTQREAWLIQQEAWLDQQHTALVQHYSELVQQHQWMQQRRRWLDRQLRQLSQQESALIQGDAAGERQLGRGIQSCFPERNYTLPLFYIAREPWYTKPRDIYAPCMGG